jgi:hypothetical protein
MGCLVVPGKRAVRHAFRGRDDVGVGLGGDGEEGDGEEGDEGEGADHVCFFLFVRFEVSYFSRLSISLCFSSQTKSVFDIWNS